MVGEHGTRFLLDGLSKLIGATSLSTPDAELCSAAMCLARLAFPLLQMLEEISDRSIDLVALTDNSTALLDIQTGYAKAMRYLKRQHRISVGMLSEAFDRPGHVLATTASGGNTSDALTKPLGPEVHERHARGMTLDLSFSSDVLTPEGAMTARAFWTNVRREEVGELAESGNETNLEMVRAVVGTIGEITDEIADALRLLSLRE